MKWGFNLDDTISTCKNFFKNNNIEERRKKLIELIAEIINFQIKVNKEI